MRPASEVNVTSTSGQLEETITSIDSQCTLDSVLLGRYQNIIPDYKLNYFRLVKV